MPPKGPGIPVDPAPPDGVRIKEYAGKGQNQILELISNIQQNEFNLPITPAQQPDLSDIKSFYQKGTGNFWIARHQDQVVGTVALLDIGNDQAALRKMFVKKEYRGSSPGIAARLLQRLLARAREQRVQDIYLGTTPFFLAAHRFYAKNGFTEIDKTDLPPAFPVMSVDTKFFKMALGPN
ncbi:MAG: GNAT family N-acetyltransferase [Desulfarculaceae bacterium]|jgi:N-acetylglutamate synthase-like GNAT family acetyltransferase